MKKLFLFSALLLSFATFAQEQHRSVVSVNGTGTVNIVPDKVLIKSRIEHTGNSAIEVKKQNDRVVSEVIKYLTSEGLASKDIQTEYIRLNKEYNYNTKETFYSANQAISILVRDLKQYESIMSGLLNTGLNRIDGIEFQTSKKAELQSEARKKAVLDAKMKAEEYAGALDQEIGSAITISEGQTENYQPVYRMMEMKSDSAEEQTLAPGEMEVTVKVNVEFLLK